MKMSVRGGLEGIPTSLGYDTFVDLVSLLIPGHYPSRENLVFIATYLWYDRLLSNNNCRFESKQIATPHYLCEMNQSIAPDFFLSLCMVEVKRLSDRARSPDAKLETNGTSLYRIRIIRPHATWVFHHL
jgi:hypothetical protein